MQFLNRFFCFVLYYGGIGTTVFSFFSPVEAARSLSTALKMPSSGCLALGRCLDYGRGLDLALFPDDVTEKYPTPEGLDAFMVQRRVFAIVDSPGHRFFMVIMDRRCSRSTLGPGLLT
jgi:hypothetical protein